MVRIQRPVGVRPSTARAAARLQRLRSLSKAAAGRIDLVTVDALRRRCRRHGHFLIGPKLQYRERTPDRGRYYVLCQGRHPGESRLGPCFQYVSDRLDNRVQRRIDRLHAAPGSERQMHSDVSEHQHGPVAPSATVLVSRSRRRSPSIEVVEATELPVAPAGCQESLRVKLFVKHGQPPLDFVLRGARSTVVYFMSAYAATWEAADIKLSQPVKILAYADEEMQVWQPTKLKSLAVLSRYSGVVLALDRVDVSQDQARELAHWACVDPMTDLGDDGWIY
ncbi:hypothetical protein PENSPDRAFT_694106 [Peniophora sp. CONT]|nr:hypothetical protein PENSPDRAFT_694106 [Peniophora sp. CONT]